MNNPVHLALSEAALLWPGVPVELLVSLGTGQPTLKLVKQNSVMVVQTADARLYLATLPTMTLAEGVAGYETMFVASPATQEESA